jgi:hypothetical protein
MDGLEIIPAYSDDRLLFLFIFCRSGNTCVKKEIKFLVIVVPSLHLSAWDTFVPAAVYSNSRISPLANAGKPL